MDSKQVAFTINSNEDFQLIFKQTENSEVKGNHPKNKVRVRMVHDGSKQVKNKKVINIIIKNAVRLHVSVNQRLANVIFTHTDGLKGKVVDLLNVVNQNVSEISKVQNTNSAHESGQHLLLQEALSNMPAAVESEKDLKAKSYLETLLHVASKKKITPFFNIEAKSESDNESEAYEAIIIMKLGEFKACGHSPENALQNAAYAALHTESFKNEIKILSITGDVNVGPEIHLEMKKRTTDDNVDQQNLQLLTNFQIVLDLALSENIIPMYYETASIAQNFETENHQYLLILEKYGNFCGTGSSKADALEDAAGQALASDVLKNKMKNLHGIFVASEDPTFSFGFESDFDVAVYIIRQNNFFYKFSSEYDEQYGIYSGWLCIGDEFRTECRSVAYKNCRNGCGRFSLMNLKQWLPNLRWYKCRLPNNKRRKTRLLDQFSANYEKIEKVGNFKLMYRKNNNVNMLTNMLKLHKINYTMTVSKGDFEVHIARCKVEKNGFSLIAEVVQKTQRDAEELSAFTALEILLYSNMFPDVRNTIRSTLLKADPSV
ncbi:hypothetical protein T4E_11395 [Trichinella pseudospiralis]|uniref:Uncharacterized protein n=1 Tax=Trichinella pseudospiralis TaxID=6337 RepID=A0A0V0XVM1_TRIPS|nr:hypothetical protein T4E_11395 [Trichinella pseudospiralis]